MTDNLFSSAAIKVPETLPLSQFEERIRKSLNSDPALQNRWIKAEINDLRSSGGHAYMELLEKDARGIAVAKIRATIWRGVLVALRNRFPQQFPTMLANGVEVRVKVSANFHILFGLTLNITDIDPDYQRDTSRLQAEILAALTAEGIRDNNKQLQIPFPPLRIAVISAAGAAGYGDFMNQLNANPNGIKFATHLFEATMQGSAVSQSVRNALERIELAADLFDCIVIIRGGGATSDLAGFDDLALARSVANCLLPVVVGIGHERDNTVLDYIANTRVKTPTAAAEWLIAQGENALAQAIDYASQIAKYVSNRLSGDTRMLEFMEEKVSLSARQRVSTAQARLNEITAALPLTVRNRIIRDSQLLERAMRTVQTSGLLHISRASARLDNALQVIRRDTSQALKREDTRLLRMTEMIEVLSPQSVLNRGYSITRINGKAIADASNLRPGDTIHTTLASGEIQSKVI